MAEPEALAKKRRTRAGHKASATRTCGQIEGIVTADAPDLSRLALLRLTLREKLDTIKTLDAEIVDAIDDETELTREIERADAYREETLFSALIKADKLLEATPTVAPPPVVTPPTGTTRSNLVRLPKLQIRRFNGDLTRWTGFWQSFDAAVNSNADLSRVEKFNYLISLLDGTAREAVAGFALTDENYDQAVATLQKRFGDTQQIISKHMEALLQIESVSSSQNVKALRRQFDNVNTHIRSLASLKVEEESYQNLLCPVLVGKLPPDMQLILSRKVTGEWTLQTLLTAVEEEITARERLDLAQRAQAKPPRRSESKAPSTATTLVSKESVQACCYCDQEHRPTDCTTVSEVDARKQILRKAGRCYSCLRRGHLSRHCRSSNKCRLCQGRHHTSICSTNAGKTATDRTTEETNSGLNPSAPVFQPTTQTLYAGTAKPVMLQTATALTYNAFDHGRNKKLHIVLDGGSQRSYITTSAREALRLPTTGKKRLAIAAFGSKRMKPQSCNVVRVEVHTKAGTTTSVDLFVVPHICEPITCQPITECLELFPHLADLELANDQTGDSRDVDMLIGADFYWCFVTGEIRRGEKGPVAIHTTLGWILSGPAGASDVTQEASASLVATHTLRIDDGVTNKMLDATMKSFWDMESMGVETDALGDDVSDRFISSVTRRGARYEVSLPWRQEGYESLPTNYELSRRRLVGLLRRLRHNPEILKKYDSTIREQLRDGIVEVVEEEKAIGPGPVHYLPHHAVIRRDKETSKVRIVYDASAKSSGPSLNDCLHVGPKFNQKINELLFRFRSYPVALVADIEKAFLMISVSPKDRDVLRFLWVEDPFSEEDKLTRLRFTRVVFGVSSSPFLLNATIRHHLEAYRSTNPELGDLLSRSICVDDVVAGADSEDEAYQLYLDSKKILRQGSFNLRKFQSNSLRLQGRLDQREAPPMTTSPASAIVPSEASYSEATIPTEPIGQPGGHKVLGVRWEPMEDQLIFDLTHLAERAVRIQPTKRNVVSVIGQIYDPLGYLSPVTIAFKILMQDVCKTKLGWDQPLTGDALAKWDALVRALRQSKPISMPRCYFDEPADTAVRLYGFCDASMAAYAAVVYIARDGGTPSFVVSKTRVAPLKTQSIPRLELMSALILSRLITSVATSLAPRYQLQPHMCFTDSQVALCWIRGADKDWKPFVQNRAEEIRRLVPSDCWRHCSGKDNPADIPSRGLDPRELPLRRLWRHGPDWLRSEVGYNAPPTAEDLPDACAAELKGGSVHTILLVQPTHSLGLVIDVRRFSCTHKLYQVTSLVLKFLRLLKRQCESSEISRQDITQAEEMWLREAQDGLLEDKKFPVWKTQFGLFQDERKLWRCGGRIQNADLPYSAKHPVLLDKKHPLTVLIIRDAHRRVQHDGVRETLTEVRSRFWIISGRSLVRSTIHGCVTCKRFEGGHFQAPPHPPLPEFRVTESPPFTYTAVDFAGPMFTRDEGSSRKVWLALFTCCATRAVHLEIVLDLTAVAFLRCVKRFAARRGLPRRFLSDNAKTFKSAAKTLKTLCSHPDTQSYLSRSGIEWSFNLEKAPWWGGLFERMIQSVKRCLRKVVGRAKFSYDELHTAIV